MILNFNIDNKIKNNIDKDSFVPIHIQEQLSKGGWILEHSSFDKDKEQLGYKGVGMQKWRKINIDTNLYFSYQCEKEIEKFGNKNVELWLSDFECEHFATRNIISVLKRRGLL